LQKGRYSLTRVWVTWGMTASKSKIKTELRGISLPSEEQTKLQLATAAAELAGNLEAAEMVLKAILPEYFIYRGGSHISIKPHDKAEVEYAMLRELQDDGRREWTSVLFDATDGDPHEIELLDYIDQITRPKMLRTRDEVVNVLRHNLPFYFVTNYPDGIHIATAEGENNLAVILEAKV